MQQNANVVIIGGGVVGISAAYHLANLGWRDIVLIEQGNFPMPGGSTSHAPGGMFQTNPIRFMTEAAHYSVLAYAEMEYEGTKAAELKGGLELAVTPERLRELYRRCAIGRSFGLQGEVISSSECKNYLPHLDSKQVFGGYFVPDDGTARTVVMVQALLNKVYEKGDAVKVYEETTVIDITTKDINGGNKQINSVVTNQGEIITDKVLCCAGFWGPKIGKMVGQPIPLTPLAHPYVTSKKIASLANISAKYGEINTPIARAQDYDLYFRATAEHWGIGSYRNKVQLIDQDQILNPREAKEMPSLIEWQNSIFEQSWSNARSLFPEIGEMDECVKKINGIFSFTNDGQSLLGESMNVRGFWVAEAIWLTHGYGLAKIVAEWIHSGEPQVDCHVADINRFQRHMVSPEFILKRGFRQYIEVYDILHPKVPSAACRTLRTSPMYHVQKELGAYFLEAAGFERPQWYESNANLLVPENTPERDAWSRQHWSPIETAEALQVRKTGGLFDISAFSILEVKGKNALPFLQKMATKNMDIPIGRMTYTNFLTDYGGIICDLTVMRISSDHFLLPTGGATGPHDLAWLKRHAPDDSSVYLADISSNFTIISLWGPKALDVLQLLTNDDVSPQGLPFFHFKQIYVGAIPVLAAHLSYVGEFGWELYTPSEFGLTLWNLLHETARPYGIIPAGAGAFNALRMEKSMRGFGTELDPDRNPLEAGLDFVISKNKGDFKGSAAIEKIRQEGIKKRLVTFTLDTNQALLGNETVYLPNGSEAIGYVTSADYGPTVGKLIGMTYLPIEYAVKGTKIEVDYLGRRYTGIVSDDILFDPQGKRVRGK